MFREALEISLIIGIILSFLVKTKQVKYNNTVYVGIAAGILTSIAAAYILTITKIGFEGRTEEIFEGITMLIGAFLLTTMIFWMMKQKNIAAKLTSKVAEHVETTNKVGLFLLVFVSVLREGIETVIFLLASAFTNSHGLWIGSLAGLAGAIILGYLIFVSSMKINIKKFFNCTSLLLILFAAGLIGHGTHELIEAGWIPAIVEHIYDVNPVLNEASFVGSILKGLFGYNGNPTLTETILYFVYLVPVMWVFYLKDCQRKSFAS